MQQFTGETEPKQGLVGHDVAGGRRSVCCHNEPPPNEEFGEDARHDDVEIEDAAYSGVALWRYSDASLGHRDLP